LFIPIVAIDCRIICCILLVELVELVEDVELVDDVVAIKVIYL
jgi:hypothetical protein